MSDLVEDISKMRDAAIGYDREVHQRSIDTIEQLQALDNDIYSELEKAISKFPRWSTDPLHAIAVLGEEFGELTKAVLQHAYEPDKATREDVREEALQTAAMAIRFCRSLSAYKYKQGQQHHQSPTED